MKAICAFCKTEFHVAKNGAGKCPVCGHRCGTPGARKNPTPKLLVAALLFLAASLFAVVSMKTFSRNRMSELLNVSIASVRYTERGYIVRGNIRNFSENTYSVPDLVFLFKTESGIVLNQVTQLPPNGLIEPMSDIEFIKKIEPKVPGAQKISVQFVEN